jgi:hypothetical protein
MKLAMAGGNALLAGAERGIGRAIRLAVDDSTRHRVGDPLVLAQQEAPSSWNWLSCLSVDRAERAVLLLDVLAGRTCAWVATP